MESALTWISQYGYAGIFALLMFGIAGLPVPDETLLVFSGYLIATGRMNLWLTFAVGVAGSICGISLSYIIGRTAGHAAIYRYGRYLHVTPAHVDRIRRWFRRMGDWLLTFGYFIPGVRHFTALVAGMSGLEYPVFARFAYSGAVIWVSTFLAIGYFVGDEWRGAVVLVERYSWFFAGALAAAVVIAWGIRAKLRSTKRVSRNSVS
ncbi:MAG: DedA family protein [Acidobacteriaceae bacterium]|nr:DedA family protein [Acidobacteriaceae bacterium]